MDWSDGYMIFNLNQMGDKALSKLQAAITIAFLILFPHFVPLPFYTYALVSILIIALLLRRDARSFRDIGLAKNKFTLKVALIGLISALIWVACMQLVYIPIIKHLFVVPDYTEYNFIKGNLSKLIITIFAAWLIGGCYEEIVFRGYIQFLLEKRLIGQAGIFSCILITSILFGLYHWQQDIFGIIAAFLGGLYWGSLCKKYNSNLWVPILSHAIFDTITLVLIYTGKFG